MSESIHESVYEFREFLYKHPQLIKEVREGKRTWNQLYQDWVILGEEHEDWSSFRVKDKDKDTTMGTGQTDSLAAIMKTLSQMNIEDLQKQISQFSGMMGNVQQALRHFQKPSGPPKPPQDPFSFRGF
ncbi:hypothetical protein D7Z54_30315 [Salibacterium salarium]|uniref:Coat protein n=1 Tax=Salibacterium salarium TaxID=284579 RepID=A0A3R9QFY9_9BACI|nr:spore coat protein YlbD [Salibacterium salarium]RSL29590.1 hypothetical protein D7Z54_30315 [Salibacterium salarium]